MLRVAHVLNSPGRGGVPRVVRALVRYSDPVDVSSHVFYLKDAVGPDLFDDTDIPRLTASAAGKAGAITELVGFLERYRIDILHTHSFRPNLYARMAGAVLWPSGLRVVAHYHNDYSDKWDGDVLLLEQRLAALTDAGVAVSDAVAGHVAARTGLRCEVVENGIDLDRVTGGSRQKGRAALCIAPDVFACGLIGRLCRQKGVDIFVEAACRVAQDLPAARFVIVGEPEDKALTETLGQRVAASGLAERITFAGHRDDMAGVLAALDLLVAPSRWEGFGLSLAEAMAAGVPVLASAVGGIPAVIGGAGQLVAPDDPRALCDAILALARDPRRRATMSAAGRVAAGRFDWSDAAARMEALYRRIGGRG